MTLEALTGLDGKLELEVPFFSLPIRLFSCLAASCVAGRRSNRLNYAERCGEFFERWEMFRTAQLRLSLVRTYARYFASGSQ